MKPFLKWVGGKRWLTHNHSTIFPTKYNNYIEPFLGGGAVFFHLMPEKAILSDSNTDLILTYEGVKQNWKKILKLLKLHQKKHSSEYYYSTRKSSVRTLETKAAKFIYLNRTCFNGLYRVNKKGEFNVPKGDKLKVIFEDDNFELISNLLQNVELNNCDFEETINKAKKGDLLFVDPPYTVRHNYNGFIKYNEKLFSWEDQERLFISLMNAKKKGAYVVSTNACHESIKQLYVNDFKMTSLVRGSTMSSKSSTRGKFEELLITSF